MTADQTDIGSERALEIARRAIAGKVELTSPGSVEVERKGRAYVVTFKRNNPPGVRAADYDARVAIDAHTGDVIELLGGS